MFSQPASTGNSVHDLLIHSYGIVMKDMLMGDYDKVQHKLEEVKAILAAQNITTFTKTTPRALNPGAWMAVEAALLLRKGDCQKAAEITEAVMRERDVILGKDITILDNASIRLLLIQIKMEAKEYDAAQQYLKEISVFFNPSLVHNEPYLTMYFSYLTYQAKCLFGQNKIDEAKAAFDSAQQFYEEHKQIVNHNMRWGLPVFANYYASFQSMLDKKNLSKLNTNFDRAAEALYECYGEMSHILIVEFSVLKARALREYGDLEQSDRLLTNAAVMMQGIFKDENHPMFQMIQKEIELLKVEKGYQNSSKNLTSFSLTPPVVVNVNAQAEVNKEFGLSNKNGM